MNNHEEWVKRFADDLDQMVEGKPPRSESAPAWYREMLDIGREMMALDFSVEQTKTNHAPIGAMNPQRLRQSQRWLAPAAAMIALLLVGAFVLLTPSGQAIAQEVIRFFVRDEDNSQTVTLYGQGAGPFPDQSGDLRNIKTTDPEPNILVTLPESLAETHPYQFYVPTYAPAGYVYEGITDYAEQNMNPQMTEMWFPCTAENYWRYSIVQYNNPSERHRDMFRPPIGPDAEVEYITIWDDVSAEYVRGDWVFPQPIYGNEVAPGESLEMEMIWSSEVDYHTLMWYAERMLFILHTSAYDTTPGANAASPCPITREDFIAIAESMVPYQP